MAEREPVFPANRQALYEAHGYFAAVRSNNLLFVSGQVGSRPDGTPEPDYEAQVRRAFANLKATLLAGGCGFGDIVDVTTFHTKAVPFLAFDATLTTGAELPVDGGWSQL